MNRDPFAREPKPVITMIIMGLAALNVLAATLLDVYTQPSDSPAWNWLGYFSAEQVRAGAIWAYLTTIFPHGGLLHLAFNLYWLWAFGRELETAKNRWPFLAVVVLTAWCGSGLQLLFSGEMGIGLSGVGYGLFGYAWVRGWFDPDIRLRRDIVWLFGGWFVFCLVITHLGWWRIGNAAHLGGFLAGAAIAPVQSGSRLWQRLLGGLGCAALLALSLVPLLRG